MGAVASIYFMVCTGAESGHLGREVCSWLYVVCRHNS